MFLTEAEAERRLLDLHRDKARIERAIADLVLFLETGRRALPDRAAHDPIFHDPTFREPISRESTSREPAARDGARQGMAPAADPGPPPRPAAPEPAPPAVDERSHARREGRLLMEAAAEILEEAGRPLHAAEILDGLTRRGLSVPGLDPVAALNTRLWKRSGAGGAFQRLGDAVYAPAGPDPDED